MFAVLGTSNAALWPSRALVAASMMAAAAAPALAQDRFIPVQIDRTHTVMAEAVTLSGGYVDIVLPQAIGRPLRLPVERVTCAASNCPVQLAELAQVAAVGGLPKNATGFQIHGSNTIGAELMPRLIQDFLKARMATFELATDELPEGKRHALEFQAEGGTKQMIDVFAFGSTTGYEKLRDKTAQIWMSSRPAKDTEIKEFKGTDLLSGDSEHVIALDGLAVVVNKGNPIGALSIDEVADIFSGKISDWKDVRESGRTGSIKVFRRDDNSGTASTFKDLVLEKRAWAPQAIALADSRKLESEVAGDAGAIGFIGVGYVANTKALAIKTKCGMAFKPDAFSIKTEEYPLSRRLFLYTSGQPSNPLAQQIVDFASSGDGQKSVREMNFVDLVMDAKGREFDEQGGRLANMLVVGAKDEIATRNFINDVRFARRISTTLRFKPNSTTPDNKSVKDIEQLADAMKSGNFGASKDFMLIGFADDTEEKAGKAADIGMERASMAGKLLQEKLDAHPNKGLAIKVYSNNIKSFGSAAPAVCNTDERGRSLNRRVEVWLK